MEIGIGLPSTIPGAERDDVLDWARRAEQRGFASVGVLDRIVYANYEPLITLAAAAAVTERVRLTTAILIVPYRANTAEVAKQAASIDRLSGGRLVLGVAVGGREDDYEASGVQMSGRERRFERQLDEMRRIWSGEQRGHAGAIGPQPAREGGPTLIVGGRVRASFERAARYGEGWIAGGGSAEDFAAQAEQVRQAWQAAGRDGSPRLMALAYFALGEQARENADRYIHDYYGFLGDYADQIAAGTAVDASAVRRYVEAFGAVGCDELILFPCSCDRAQVDLLAAAAL